MEDTKSLVTIFLQKIFHDRQHIIDSTYKLIYDYNNGERRKTDYEKTLKGICSHLGKEIPNQVLVYLLTLVDMPLDLAESDDTELNPVIEKIKTLEEMQKSQNCLAESIKPHLEECVSRKKDANDKYVPKPRDCCLGKNEEKEPNVGEQSKEKRNAQKGTKGLDLIKRAANSPAQTECTKSPEAPKPTSKPKNRRKNGDKTENWRQTKSRTVQTLLDLTAVSVIQNQHKLKRFYQRKFEKAWKLVNSNRCKGEALQQCYQTLRDLNKKRKLLRDIENDNITDEVMAELYQDTDIFLKEKHVYEVVNMDMYEYAMKISAKTLNNVNS